MLGSVGFTVSWYCFSSTAVTGSPAVQRRMSAAPPSAVKIGAPSATETSNRIIAGQRNGSGSISRPFTNMTTASSAAARASVTSFHCQRSAACQIRRTVINPKPTTSSSWMTHTSTP